MTGVDEVGAHCGLFFLGDVCGELVRGVAGRIEEWVGEEDTRRVLEGEGEGGVENRFSSSGWEGGVRGTMGFNS